VLLFEFAGEKSVSELMRVMMDAASRGARSQTVSLDADALPATDG
jgi:hypothetical protein